MSNTLHTRGAFARRAPGQGRDTSGTIRTRGAFASISQEQELDTSGTIRTQGVFASVSQEQGRDVSGTIHTRGVFASVSQEQGRDMSGTIRTRGAFARRAPGQGRDMSGTIHTRGAFARRAPGQGRDMSGTIHTRGVFARRAPGQGRDVSGTIRTRGVFARVSRRQERDVSGTIRAWGVFARRAPGQGRDTSDTIWVFLALVLLLRKEDRVKCVILGKAGSTRVKLKNYRPFYREQSLMDILLAKLTAVIRREDVYLSCEREEYRKVAEAWGVGFIHRDERYTAFTTSNVDVVRNVCKDVPGNEDILWVSSVEPFFDEFPQVLECWDKVDKRTYDSLNVVYPKKMFLLDQNHNPIGWGFGHWHKYSQELPPVYQMSWAVAILSRQCISEVSYIIGARPYWYESTAEAVDIDTEDDWELAQEMYRQKQAKVKVND